jgi:hypothetical protein
MERRGKGADASQCLCCATGAHSLRITRVRSWLLPIGLLAIAFTSFSSAPSADAAFGFKTLSLTFANEDASPTTQAGSHPYAWTTALTLNTIGAPDEELPDGALKDLRIQLPAGLIGTPGLLPHCSHADFITQTCPAASEVGTIGLSTSSAETEGLEFPIYNLEPLPGNAAELAFTASSVPITIELQIATKPPYNLIAQITNTSQVAAFFGSTLTIHGVPGSVPFLTLPRSCAPAPTNFEAAPWAAPTAWVSSQAPTPLTPTGCGKLGFSPILDIRPTTTSATAPTGLNLSLDAPDEGLTSPTGTAQADIASAVLNFPPRMTINPALAAGLTACSPAELARETPTSAPGEGCPQAAKIGTASATTALLDTPVAGTIFAAAPDDPATTAPGAENPFDAPFALYLVLRDATRGILVTIPIEVAADPGDGRLTATLAQLPQLPLSRLELHFNSGPHAPLTSPTCGTHTIATSLTPSSGAAPLPGAASFATDQDCNAPSFSPDLSAGTSSNAAGTAAPFTFDLASDPAEPNPAALSLTLPPGLSASFAATATCPEPATRTSSCPPDSRLGHARIALGPGPEPLWIPEAGKAASAVYLAGPYRSAPYSLLIKVPAEAGPFELGTVILRAAIEIDPTSARATVAIDKLPQVLGGVPLHYRTIRLVLERAGFIRNPTSCAPTQVAATVTSAAGTTATLSDRFQAANCAALGLKPRFALRLSGGLGRNAHPTLNIDVAPRAADANLRAASLALPYGLFIDPTRLRATCTRKRFAVHECPPSARLGWAEVTSPLLPQPERGRLFLIEGDGQLPDLGASLGGRVPLDLHGHLSAHNTRIQASFEPLPDVPLSHLRLVLKGGFRGLLVNSETLCRHRAPLVRATFLGHNSKQRRIRPRTEVRCPR